MAKRKRVKVYVGLRVVWRRENGEPWLGTVDDAATAPEIGIAWDNGHWGTGWDLHKPPYELFAAETGATITW